MLTADVDAEVGLVTCEWNGVSRRARLSIPERSRARVWSDSSQRRAHVCNTFDSCACRYAWEPPRVRSHEFEDVKEVIEAAEKRQVAMAIQHKECAKKQASQQHQSGSGRMEQEQSGSSTKRQHALQRKACTK